VEAWEESRFGHQS
jgi:hypothetical protein